MISVIIPEGYRWYSIRIQRNSFKSNFNKLFFSCKIGQIYSLHCTTRGPRGLKSLTWETCL